MLTLMRRVIGLVMAMVSLVCMVSLPCLGVILLSMGSKSTHAAPISLTAKIIILAILGLITILSAWAALTLLRRPTQGEALEPIASRALPISSASITKENTKSTKAAASWLSDWRVRLFVAPLGMGMLSALALNSTQNQELYEAMQTAPAVSFSGPLSYSGLGRIHPSILTAQGAIPINCNTGKDRSSCLPDLDGPKRLAGTVNAFSYRGSYFIKSVKLDDGVEILSLKAQRLQLYKYAEFERRHGFWTYFIVGTLLGLAMVGLYQFFLKFFARVIGPARPTDKLRRSIR